MYIAIVIVLLFLKGKSYYTIGIYPALVAAGAYFFEKISISWLKYSVRTIITGMMIILIIPVLPVSLHLLPADRLNLTAGC